MAIYELGQDTIKLISETTFESEKIKERYDLQRLLRDRIDIIDSDLMVITEEFGNWEESKRRLDILALDRNANLVVIELKRTQDGGFMDLQAVRYAAMISTMTFDQVVEAHEDYLMKRSALQNARQAILDFLEWDEPREDQFAQDVRIILISAEFSKELTTAVMWLNARDINIRCIRIKPYNLAGKVIVDIQQIIPLPEAEEYQVKVKEKDLRKRSAKSSEMTMPEVWEELKANCTEDVVLVAQEIETWLHEQVDQLFPVSHGFAQVLTSGKNKHYFFKITTDGRVQIWFQYMSKKPPFSDESLRQELRNKLRTIPGVEIDESKLAGKPSFPLNKLVRKESMDVFKSTMEWVFGKVMEDQ